MVYLKDGKRNYNIGDRITVLGTSEYNFLIGTPMTISNVLAGETLVLNTPDGKYWLYMTASTGSDLTWTIPQGAFLSNGSDSIALVAGDYIIKTFNNLTSNVFTITEATEMTASSEYNFLIGTPMTISNVPADEILVLNTSDQLYWLYMTASTGGDLTWTIPQGAFLSNGSETTPLVAGNYIIKTFNNLTSNTFAITEATEIRGTYPNRGWVLADNSGTFKGSTENQIFRETDLYKNMLDAYKYYSDYSVPAACYIAKKMPMNAKTLNVCSSLIRNMKIDATVKAKHGVDLNPLGSSCYIMDIMYRGITVEGNINNWKGAYNSSYGTSYSDTYTGDSDESKSSEIYETMPSSLSPINNVLYKYQTPESNNYAHYVDSYSFYGEQAAVNECCYNLASEIGQGTSIQTAEIEFMGNAGNYIKEDDVYKVKQPTVGDGWDNFNVYNMSKYGLNVLSAPGVSLSTL